MKLPIKGSCPFLDYVLHYEYWPARPGCMYRRNGDPGDPPEPAEAEWSFHLADGSEVPDDEIVSQYSDDYTEEQFVELIYEAIENDIAQREQEDY